MTNSQNGITVIVLSFERLTSLQLMLESLRAQKLGDIQLELIVCNNSSKVQLKQTPVSAIGRTLSKFRDIKILNVNYSWRTSIRYALASLAKYETILFLDDDVILLQKDFVAYMFNTFKQLRPVDLLSCWNRLWLDWDQNPIRLVSLTFKTPEITQLTLSDVAGPGICMFDKQILTPGVLNAVMKPDFPNAYDMGFSLITSIEHGSRCYFLPSYGMLEFHDQSRKAALMAPANRNGDLDAMFRSMMTRGYKPVLSRLSDAEWEQSPERRAVKLLSEHN